MGSERAAEKALQFQINKMKRPFVTLKFAQTLDGKIAAPDGSSRWISCPESLKFAHRLRAENDAILVGIGTILKDNPILTTRRVKGKNPLRVIIDTKLRIPLSAQVVRKAKNAKTIIFTKRKSSLKIKKLENLGVETIIISRNGADIDLKEILRILYKKGIRSLLVEGGKRIITSFLQERLPDKIIVVISPKILGKGVESVGSLGINNIREAFKLRTQTIKKSGKDIIYIAGFKK